MRNDRGPEMALNVDNLKTRQEKMAKLAPKWAERGILFSDDVQEGEIEITVAEQMQNMGEQLKGIFSFGNNHDDDHNNRKKMKLAGELDVLDVDLEGISTDDDNNNNSKNKNNNKNNNNISNNKNHQNSKKNELDDDFDSDDNVEKNANKGKGSIEDMNAVLQSPRGADSKNSSNLAAPPFLSPLSARPDGVPNN